jgi:hypothetical protein
MHSRCAAKCLFCAMQRRLHSTETNSWGCMEHSRKHLLFVVCLCVNMGLDVGDCSRFTICMQVSKSCKQWGRDQ